MYFYTVPGTGGAAPFNRLSRFTAAGDVAVVGSERVLLNLEPLSAATNHNGGGLQFGPDGKLYVGVGENANPANSQSLSNRLGKLLRINSDGTIPTDNPNSFAGVAGTTSGVNRAIWAVGLRNPFSFAVQPGTGRVFINDVGQNTFRGDRQGSARDYGGRRPKGTSARRRSRTSPNPCTLRRPGGPNFSGRSINGGVFYSRSPQVPRRVRRRSSSSTCSAGGSADSTRANAVTSRHGHHGRSRSG